MILYSGAAGAPVTISSGATASVVLNLELAMSRRPSPFMNAAPVITALSASAADVTPGATVSIAAMATDPDGDAMTYRWSATGGAFSTTNALSTVWTAPAAESNYDLTLVVSDARGASSSARYRVRVAASNGRGNADIQVVLMSPPDITNFTLSSPDTTGTSTLAVTATDPDGDAMTYSWSSNCDGYFNGNMALLRAWPMSSAAMTTFTQAAADACTLSVVVRDVNGHQNPATNTRTAGPSPKTPRTVWPL